VYKKILVSELVADGEELVKALERHRFRIDSAFWIQPEGESGDWILVIASPVVDLVGPLVSYQRIRRALADLRDGTQLELSDIRAVGITEQVYQSLRALAIAPSVAGHGPATGPHRNVVFERAYIYRWPRSAA
jgi:hypothetical protein